MIKQFPNLLVVVGLFLGASFALAQEANLVSNQNTKLDSSESVSTTRSERSNLIKSEGIVMLDYEVIPVPGNKSIDLMGFHLLNKVNDWMYLGVGGYAPLFNGEYGGFMAFDVTAHVQRRIFGNFFAAAGLSMGGGGGGKSTEQSKILSGTGGFVKSYIGLGYDFRDFSVGLNLAKMKFTKSAIDNSQFNIYVQVPFSYSIGSYASSGDRVFSADKPDAERTFVDSGENTLTVGLDNFLQINPEGLIKETIHIADLQFSHFMTKNSYWYATAGVGYHGMPLYNQVLGGLGYRVRISPNVNLYSQLALGSGGYDPETINTGSGLLVYPKISAEYLLDKNLGFSLSAGYLFAPMGSSKNYTFGASLNYRIHSGGESSAASDTNESVVYRGYRFNLFQQTEFNVKYRDIGRSKINLLSAQIDKIMSDHIYIPIQVSVAYDTYLGYPGYGELLAGIGVQNKYYENNRFQLFGQFLVGTNVHGQILKTGVGMNYGVSDRLAIYALVGQTFSIDKEKEFKSDYVGLGMTYRFSVPSW